jgi:tRNA nucleotidyltransferase (CCA-adding enzyme)
MAASWEHFEHGADIGVRGIADSEEEAFVQAAIALTAVVTNPDSVKQSVSVAIQCDAPDHELLFAEWLNAIIYEMATQNMLFSEFNINIENNSLTATLRGETVDIERHSPAVEIKGATYTSLKVAKDEDGKWLAQCVVDV